jgi:hypothetical protein
VREVAAMGWAVSLDQWNQTPAHPTRIIVIALETDAQRLFLDADPDDEQEGEEGDHHKAPPLAEDKRGPGDVEQRAESEVLKMEDCCWLMVSNISIWRQVLKARKATF